MTSIERKESPSESTRLSTRELRRELKKIGILDENALKSMKKPELQELWEKRDFLRSLYATVHGLEGRAKGP